MDKIRNLAGKGMERGQVNLLQRGQNKNKNETMKTKVLIFLC